MKFAERVQSFLAKSFGGEGNGDLDEKKKKDSDFEDQDEEGTVETEGDEDMEKGLVDATEILGSLVTELREIRKSLKTLTEKQDTLEKSQIDVGEAVVCISEVVGKIAGIPVSTKSVMAKGNLGGGAASGGFTRQVTQPKVQPTQAEFERAQNVLFKSVQAGEITMQYAEMVSSDMQKSMAYPSYAMKQEYFEFLARKMQAA
jgi:hypothetical protein